MVEFTMPALGADMEEGTLNEWLVAPGDTVSRGQVVAVVETTKAAVEVECWQEGTVGELLVPVGETVQVGTALATLLTSGEQAPAEPAAPRQAEPAAPRQAEPAAPPRAEPAAPPVAPPGHRRWVSPLARREAASLGVDLDAVTGTGPQDSVTVDDVHRAAEKVSTEPTPPAEPAKKAAAKHPRKATPKPEPKPERKSDAAAKAAARGAAMRASIAAAMGRSKREIPHYYLSHHVMLDKTLDWLAERNAQRSILERVLPAVLQIKAVSLAAQRFPEFNGFWKDDTFQPSSDVHVGVAISLRGGGLVAPAIHDTPGKKLDELMSDLTDLVARARAFSLRSSEMSDPTITVTNLGDKAVDAVFGVIYPPQVALVGFGTPAPQVVAVDGGIRIATMAQATLSADHRASDGHRGALFLAEITRLLQDPDTLEE